MPLIVALLAVCAFFLDTLLSTSLDTLPDTAFSDNFIYHRNAITQGQWWRLFTGHFFHTNGFHLLLNLAALALLFGLHGKFYNIKNYTALFLSSALITSGGIYHFSPQLQQYVGLSGVLHGVFIWGALMDIKNKDKTGYLLFIAVCLKIAHEQIYGASGDLASLIEANVAIDAHLWGALGGLCCAIFSFMPKKLALK